MKLVIVESPTKAKTIKRFLPKDYAVESSFGHIRDLPQSAEDIPAAYKKNSWARLGVNVTENFAPLYVIPNDKKKQVAKLKQLLKDADALYLASDEDREGEAISWHLLEVLKPTIPVYRMVFHEITKEAITAALENPRELDMHLVEAQETRRILDRLYGYEVSPVLWRKVAPKLSAGRVQSAAVSLIVEREQQRINFHTSNYYDVLGTFTTATNETFEARLVSNASKKIAAGKDFDSATGKLLNHLADKVTVLNETNAAELVKQWQHSSWQVTDVQQKPITSRPYAPFITSTLQQEAGRKLGLSASQTMRLAQRLYEQGMITYMRTDSIQLSQQAISAARARIEQLYGADYVPASPRIYKSKNKLAQEAHEAIRPAGTSMATPEELKNNLDSDQLRLYELIWKRTIASQMADAQMLQTTVKLEQSKALFQASGRVIKFPGYLRVYVEGSDDPEADLSERDKTLPNLNTNDTVIATTLSANPHTTQPPARFTEAALVKELETKGIGRPSTYATIIDTIQRRGYIHKEHGALIPRFVAFAVTNLLRSHFSNLVDAKYTASMEEDLDAIAAGTKKHLPYLQQFYFGDLPELPGLHELVKTEIDPRQVCTIPIGTAPDDKAVNVRVGRFGPFVEHITNGEESKTASIPTDLPPDELTVAAALEFIEKHQAGPTELGKDPVTGKAVYVLEGRFGPYVQLGSASSRDTETTQDSPEKKKSTKKTKKPKIIKPKMKGLLRGMKPADVTLETALQLLNLPKVIGVYPKSGENIVADNGRFGPYIRCGIETRSLNKDYNLLELTFEQACTFLDTPKLGRGNRSKSSVLKIIGEYPATKDKIQLCTGKYGHYLKVGKKNVSVPKGTDPQSLTLAEAITLVEKKLK
ncbi:MAG: type I DNA topoisomerase [Patescibacteria group bacterium]|jgi:DNA topoisomerase-1